MSRPDIQIKIQQFLKSRLKNLDLQDDIDYFERGVVNSLFALQLVLFVEKEFEIKVQDEDLKIENFNTIRSLAAFVQRKLAGAAAAAEPSAPN